MKTARIVGVIAILSIFAAVLVTNYNVAFAAVLVTNYNVAFAEELSCMKGEIVVIRTTNPKPICVEETTAQKWVTWKIATIIETTEPETLSEPEDTTEEPPQIEEETSQPEPITPSAPKELQSIPKHSYTIGTITSEQDSGIGHETHQLAILLPPSENVYVGQLTYSASEPIQLIALHGPLAEGEDLGQPIWTPDNKTKYALTLVNTGQQMGTWTFTGNALAAHTINPDGFTISYTVATQK